jgi:phosphomannomutase
VESRLEGPAGDDRRARVTGSDRTDGFRFLLDGGGWALIRLPGTEPLMRIYTEVQEEELVARVLRECREMTGA